MPFHTPNCNPNVSPTDKRLQMTCEGPVYSKCRMVIVLLIYEQDMLCVPLYTFNSSGLRNKPNHVKREYVSAMNENEEGFINQGVYPPIEIKMNKFPLHPDTTVHITGGLKVGCQENVARVGRTTRESYNRLMTLWKDLNEAAKKQRW